MLLAFLVYVVSNLAYNGSFFFVIGALTILAYISINIFKFLYMLMNTAPNIRIIKGKKYKLKDSSDYITPTDVFETTRTIYVGMKKYEYGCFVEMLDLPDPEESQIGKLQVSKKWLYAGIFALVLHTLLPNRDTMIYCASAYIVQTVITDDRTQELSSAAYDATLSQLREWSKENKDVEKLIQPLVAKAKETLKNETN